MMKLIRNTEYGNMAKGIFILVLVTCMVTWGLWEASYLTGAGDDAYSFSFLFVTAQGAVIIGAYILWYREANRLASDLYNITEMRKAAHSRIPRYLLSAIVITLIIAAAAVIAMVFILFLANINGIYIFSSALSELLIGNFALILLMYFFGLPNRVLGRY